MRAQASRRERRRVRRVKGVHALRQRAELAPDPSGGSRIQGSASSGWIRIRPGLRGRPVGVPAPVPRAARGPRARRPRRGARDTRDLRCMRHRGVSGLPDPTEKAPSEPERPRAGSRMSGGVRVRDPGRRRRSVPGLSAGQLRPAGLSDRPPPGGGLPAGDRRRSRSVNEHEGDTSLSVMLSSQTTTQRCSGTQRRFRREGAVGPRWIQPATAPRHAVLRPRGGAGEGQQAEPEQRRADDDEVELFADEPGR